MEISHQRAERLYLKLLFGTLAAIVVLVAVGWGGHDLYVRWQERRLTRQAIYALQHGDDNTASLAARTILELKPSSAPAARVMAELAEKTGNRVALDWRRKVVQMEPHSVDDALAWVRCALQFNDIATAQRALSEVGENGKATAAYHAARALLAQAQRQEQIADDEWSESIRLAPGQKSYQLQLGMLRVRASEPERRASGEALLNALRSDPQQRIFAMRALIAAGAARHEPSQRLLDLARELQGYPEATISDRLLFLDFLHQVQDSQFSSYLTEVETSVAKQPSDLAELLSWMSTNNLNLLALDFFKTVPPDNLEKWPVPLALADIYARLNEWRKLENSIKNANWRQFEFLRHAYLTRALRAQDKPAAAEHEWSEAVKDASGQAAALLSLAHVTADWKWDREMVDLLWTLSKDPEKQYEAIQTLYQYYAKIRDTQGLYRVLVRWAELAPDDLNVRNNLAQVSLLLGANPEEARRLAAEVYQRMPSNAAYASTYAYSLLTNGNVKGAARVMSSLSEDQLRDPAVSAYYGICLAALRDERARSFLEAGRGARLLPEEKALIDKAAANLNSPGSAQPPNE